MNTLQEDAVNNFILDYLPPSTNNISLSKTKCITQLKRRIIRVDALQKHCQVLNNHLFEKGRELEDTLKKLDSTQEEYKQTSLEYKETLENVSRFEMENQKLKAALETLEQQHLKAVTQLGASRSHIVQLEQLVKQKDKKIESMEKYDPKNIEKIIAERIGADLKEKDREKILWKKRYERLQKKIKDIDSKKTDNKASLQSTENTSDCQSLDGHSDNEDNNSVEYMSRLIEQELCQDKTRMIKTSPNNLKEHVELDNDYSNEIISIDTGCGSSLASSDNEKWLNSPDYMFSPIHADNTENYRGRKLTTVGTSPILLKNVNDNSTSPILSVSTKDAGISPIKSMKKNDVATSPIHMVFSPIHSDNMENYCNCKLTTVGTSPILFNNVNDIATSPILSISTNDAGTSPIKPMKKNDVATSPIHMKFSSNHADDTENYCGRKLTTVGTSPILFNNINDIATSPILSISTNDARISTIKLMKKNDVVTSPIPIELEINKSEIAKDREAIEPFIINSGSTSCLNNTKETDIATSPILSISTNDAGINPIKPMKKNDVVTSPIHMELELDINKSEIAKDREAIEPFIINSDSTSYLNNTKETAKNFVNISENFVDMDMLESENAEETTVKQLGSLNCINDIDMPEIIRKTKEDNVTPVIRLEGTTNPDIQITISATEESFTKQLNNLTDITSPDFAKEELETTSIRDENDTNVIQISKKLPTVDLQESVSDSKQIEDKREKIIEKINIVKDITSPEWDEEERESISITKETYTNPNEISRNTSITDIHERSSDIKEIEHSMPITLEKCFTETQAKSTVLLKSDADLIGVVQTKEATEKELLNVNSSNGMNVDDDIDNEIVMILNSMRFNRKLITPLPRTPVKTISQPANINTCEISVEKLKHTSCQDAAIAKDLAGAAKEEAASAREYVTKLREDHIKLMADFKKLQKDMINIKSIFKSQLSLRDNTKHQKNDAVYSPSKDFSSSYLRDRSSKRHRIFSLNQQQDGIEEQDNNIKLLCDELQEPGTKNNLEKLQTFIPKSSKTSRSDESQDRPKPLGNNGGGILQSEDNVDLVNPQPNSFNSKHLYTSVRKKSSSHESKDITIANNGEIILQKGDNTVDVLDPLPKQPVVEKLKIISDNIIKPAELEHLKSKQDWSNDIQKSQLSTAQECIVQQCNQEQHKDLPPEVESYDDGTKTDEELDKSQGKKNKKKKCRKTKKLSNLDKYRKKCEKPLFKIKRETLPLPKSTKPKQLRVFLRKITDFDNSATLNDKNVYANAVKIMAELKAKNSISSTKSITDTETQSAMEKDKDRPINFSEISLKSVVSSISTKDFDSNFLNPTEITCSKSTSLCSSSPTKSPIKSTIVTRSRKMSEQCNNNNTLEGSVTSVTEVCKNSLEHTSHSPVKNNNNNHQNVTETPIVSRKRNLSDCSDTPLASRKRKLSDCSDTPPKKVLRNTQNIITDANKVEHENDKKEPIVSINKNPKESILCVMIEKYGKRSISYKTRNTQDEDSKTICENIEKFMSDIQQLTCKQKRDELVEDLQSYSHKKFIGGLMLYLNNSERKSELFSKMSGVPGQIQITKPEAVLMYVIKQLRKHWSSVDLVEAILSNIEFILFRLNQTPTFEVVESMSHFYAVLCRLSDDRDRLITFMLDSMYCILFKSVVLIKQCLEAWPNIIPLAHMSKAKTPLMTCFVYLLHFFKCEDRFNRLPEIRNILHRRYYYEIKDWNELKIIDLLKTSIKELRDNEHDKKMLRIALIVFGKRHGPKWTNNNIIKKILQPFIENQNTPNYIRVFCISLIGPLYKPYPVDMKVHCDIALDQLITILNTTQSKQIAEAALSSIVLMGRHNYQRVTELLISRKMDKIGPQLEELIRDHVRSRTVNTWLRILPKISHDCNKTTN